MSAAVRVRVVGFVDRPTVEWPAGFPIPRVGDPVHVGDDMYTVRTVAWYPAGDNDAASPEPFVYVVLGPHR